MLSLFWTYVQYRRRVAVMSFDEMVLRAMLRLARRRVAAHEGDIALRVGETERSVRVSMRRLEASSLIERRAGPTARLTLSGLAVAVALLPRAAAASLPTARASRAA
jgi:Mn-dependent DtxR family transcriptional regulator